MRKAMLEDDKRTGGWGVLVGALSVPILLLGDIPASVAAAIGVGLVVVTHMGTATISQYSTPQERSVWIGVDGVFFPGMFVRHDQIQSASLRENSVHFDLQHPRTLKFGDSKQAEDALHEYRTRRDHFALLSAASSSPIAKGYRESRIELRRTELGRFLVGEISKRDVDPGVLDALGPSLADRRRLR